VRSKDTGQNAQRERLRRHLRDKGFGCLRKSVWISPDPLTAERPVLGGGSINVESLILLEARPCAGASDAEMVAGAWDFERIKPLCPASENPRGAARCSTYEAGPLKASGGGNSFTSSQ
jgi:hypothetical protein